MIQVKCTVETLLRQSGIQITREGDILPYENGEDAYHQEEDELYPKEEDEEDMVKVNTYTYIHIGLLSADSLYPIERYT